MPKSDNYINNISERIRLYRELDNIETEEKLLDFEDNLKDRFGEIPEQTAELLNVVRLRWMAVKLGFEKIILKNNKMVAYFISNQESPYYKSAIFSGILGFIQQNPKGIIMKEINNKLTMSFIKTFSIQIAIEKLQKIIV